MEVSDAAVTQSESSPLRPTERTVLGISFLVVCVVAALLGFLGMYQWGSPVEIPRELADLPATAPAEKLVLKQVATEAMLFWNSVISLTMLLAVVGLVTCGFVGWRRSTRAGILASVGGGLILGFSGAVLALGGWYLRQSLHPILEADLSQMLKTLLLHVGVWGLTGVVLGFTVAKFGKLPGSSINYLVAGCLGGVLAGCLYSPLAAIAFPMENTDQLIPTGIGNGVFWSVFSFGAIASAVVLSGRKR